MKTKIAPQKHKQALKKNPLCCVRQWLLWSLVLITLDWGKNPTVHLHVSLNSFFSELRSGPFPASSLFDQERASAQDVRQHKEMFCLFM